MKRGLPEEVGRDSGISSSVKRKKKKVQQQLVRPSEVPEYLRDTEFYRSLDKEDDEPFHIPAGHMKENKDIESLQDVHNLLLTVRYWGMNESVVRVPVILLASKLSFAKVNAVLCEFQDEFSFVKGLTVALDKEHTLERRMEAAMELGVIELVNWLDRKEGVVYTEKAIALAASLGHVDCLKHGMRALKRQISHRWQNVSDHIADGAVLNGHLECVKVLFESDVRLRRSLQDYEIRALPNLIRIAAEHGQLKCLQYLHSAQRYPLIGCASVAAASGSLDCLKYVVDWYKIYNLQWKEQVCIAAAENGHLHCLEYLREQGYLWDYNVGIAAAAAGSLPGLQYYHANGGERHYMVCHAAALNGHLPCLQYLHEHGCPFMPTTISARVNKEYQRRFNVTSGVMHLVEQVAQHKHWACVLYLILQNYPLTRGLTAHLARGHKDSLLQLAVERGCVLAKAVGVLYAKAGRSESLHYALDHGCEPSEQILCAAASKGHSDCLAYAHEQGCPWSKEVCVAAARGGHLECLQYAREHGCPWNNKVRVVATRRKHEHILEYVMQMCPVAA